MNELELARAIAAGTAPSPSQYGNAWLHDIRISGTGIAERPALGETAYRAPEIWCSDDMVQRAAGLPVILGHPADKILNADEYAARVIGAVVLPYARDGELRGVARVFDDAASAGMASGEFSTSPGAVAAGTSVSGPDGILLIEKDPALLDHIAIVPNKGDVGGGVWDKGGAGNGIRNDSTEKESVMTEKAPEENAAEEHGAMLKKITEGLEGLTGLCQSLATRMDTVEAGMKNRPDQQDEIEAGNLSIADKNADAAEKADAQAKCDAIATQHGMRAPAPMMGEKPRAYRIRLLRSFQHFSKEFGKADLKLLADDVFGSVEARIYADAAEAAKRPHVPAGELRMVTLRNDDTGHITREFHGSPRAWMAQFGGVTYKARILDRSKVA